MVGLHTSIFLDTRRPLNDGTFPIKLRITYKRERKYYPTEFSLSEEDFSKTQAEKPRGKYKQIQIELQAIETLAIETIKKLPAFSFQAFEQRFKEAASQDDVFAAFDLAIERLNREGQIGTAKTYENASISLLSFLFKEPMTRNKGLSHEQASAKRKAFLNKRKPLTYAAITPDFLKEYEKWMLKGGKSTTTIGIYLRNLRTLFNEAIENGSLLPDLYPFGKRKYQIPASRNTKKALPKQEIAKIFSYEPRHDKEARARDLWCFTYLCNGINLKDIARLRYSQVSKDTITFIRAKTNRTTRHDQRTIHVPLLPQASQIIQRWGNRNVHGDTYVFPILSEGLTPERELAVVRQAIKTINTYMKKIAAQLGIETNISTYSARHSFSTILKRAGVSTALISEALGHSSEKTTQSYLDSFEDDMKRQIASHLTDF